MQIPRVQFYRGFVQRANSERATRVPSETPQESISVGMTSDILTWNPSKELGLAKAAARQAALELSPTAAVRIALAIALEVTSSEIETKDADDFLRVVAPTRPLENQTDLAESFLEIQPFLDPTLPSPLLSEATIFGEGAHAGNQVILNPSLLDEPNLAAFVLGHEIGHAELRHGVQSAALRELSQLLADTDSNRQVLRKANQELELQADARAAELSAKLDVDPLPILKTLLKSQEDEDHPPGELRAQAVREHFAKHGVKVTDRQWLSLLEETATIRAKYAEKSLREAAYRDMLKSYV